MVDSCRYEFSKVNRRAELLVLSILWFFVFDNQAHKNSAIVTVDPLV